MCTPSMWLTTFGMGLPGTNLVAAGCLLCPLAEASCSREQRAFLLTLALALLGLPNKVLELGRLCGAPCPNCFHCGACETLEHLFIK